jgi:hypothetical protein
LDEARKEELVLQTVFKSTSIPSSSKDLFVVKCLPTFPNAITTSNFIR